MIFSCGSESEVKPMRLAGTCSRYSKSAMPQLTSAAIHHGLSDRFLRCAYQANVMNTFDATRSNAQLAVAGNVVMGRSSRLAGQAGARGNRRRVRGRE